eukprot:scaffold390010_cov19-Prasinocladus_malaysianus.AAC.1
MMNNDALTTHIKPLQMLSPCISLNGVARHGDSILAWRAYISNVPPVVVFPPADELLLDLEKFTGRSASDSYDDNPVAAVPELIESLGRDASELINSLTAQERAADDN